MHSKGSYFNHRGFTLIELAVVMIISGILMVGGLEIYRVYLKSEKLSGNYEKMDKFNTAIDAFYTTQKRYPCPADPALPETSPLAGVENCIASTPVGLCSGGICKVAGRDADTDGTPDNVLIGSIPYKTLKLGRDDMNAYDGVIKDDVSICNAAFLAGGPIPSPPCPSSMGSVLKHESSIQDINAEDSLDTWGNSITYTVSAKLTSNATGSFDISYGAITVQTESGAQLSDPAGSVMWALISHGEDGNGAYNAYGKIVNSCGTVAADIENCDNDSTFINGIIAKASGASYFDDITYFSASRLSSLWTNAQTTPSTGSDDSKDITNRNIGNVGVGLPAGIPPAERLDVANTLKANKVMSQRVCDTTGTKCFYQGHFGGPLGELCAPPAPGTINVVTKISNGTVQCVTVTLPTTFAGQSCSTPSDVMKGVDSLGNIICGAP